MEIQLQPNQQLDPEAIGFSRMEIQLQPSGI